MTRRDFLEHLVDHLNHGSRLLYNDPDAVDPDVVTYLYELYGGPDATAEVVDFAQVAADWRRYVKDRDE